MWLGGLAFDLGLIFPLQESCSDRSEGLSSTGLILSSSCLREKNFNWFCAAVCHTYSALCLSLGPAVTAIIDLKSVSAVAHAISDLPNMTNVNNKWGYRTRQGNIAGWFTFSGTKKLWQERTVPFILWHFIECQILVMMNTHQLPLR